ncbi:MAG: sulfotransferase domain-containing protein, partial [Pyrinomonadaceae bacterium]
MLPNLVIAGAPKCGTSSLYRWLADHPQACGSKVKETFYLMDEGHPLLRRETNFHRDGLAGYAAFFGGARAPRDCRVVFEATTHYIYQRTPLEVLSRLKPPPQIVFVLRKPSERVYSSFQYSKHNLANVRGDLSFARYVALARGGADSSSLAALAGESAYVLARDIGYSRYAEHIAPWVERFGRGRVNVLRFEDMRANPRDFMKNLAARIWIDPSF